MARRRVVVTGLGMLTPLGATVQTSWDGILAGRSGIAAIEHFDASAYNTRISGQVDGFDVTDYMAAKDARKIDIFLQYGIAAASQAITDSGVEINEQNARRAGVVMGSGIGGLSMIEETASTLINSGPRRISPFFVPGAIINMISGRLSIMYGLKGPNYAIATACTTGTHCIGMAARNIAYGEADIMIAGGAEKASCELGMAGFSAARAMSTRNDAPSAASRPWDQDRDGFVLGDGAGALVLEEYEHAVNRGARIYAELTGFGMSGDAFHMTAPPENGEGAAASMLNAIDDAALQPAQIDYINAHGTSTPAGDIAESQAVEAVMGDHAAQVAVSSTKSMIGHLLGAAGAVEAIFSILSIRDQIAPPTINLDNPGEGCRLDYVPNQARKMNITHALSNSFGFGGTNGSLLFSRIES
ncbi:beta-ketoacyl-ACP synthase II [Aestuariirhabdus sp. Z084]|uniref:beta-ketoacyl-ACP synthase II n=1 Tax=Aestuariirhabdus haliotis TaxID=2918751 RepID=UPI00201B4221|nr:beta-ketoacyl-ACP synthase II [Aestuariirhabdus haliotis]MCL6414804.1 beta-ketoacyl-ACP synthase II [Aestuariirhabdus haliotis]MCL6418736.1 beta-ketoacyl-ACP synthase II [Aestuariirhabdus haliotis]